MQQADALFFVGVTRAQQAMLATYATSASGRSRASKRELTPLLSRWLEAHTPAMQHWPSEAAPPETVTLDAIWGGEPRGSLATRALDAQSCAVRTYLEHYLRMRFPVATQTALSHFYRRRAAHHGPHCAAVSRIGRSRVPG